MFAKPKALILDANILVRAVFGSRVRQLIGSHEESIFLLLKDKGGDAIAALHHPEVGDIDLVYGSEGTPERKYSDGYGLAKIAKKHPEVVGDLQGLLDGMKVTSRSDNRIQLADDEHKAAIRLNWEGKEKKWLLTAYRKDEGGSATASGSTDVAGRAEPAPTPAGPEADTGSLHQSSSDDLLYQETRGGFDPSSLTTLLGKKADMSTFLHETAHYFLCMPDIAPAK